MWLLAFLVFVVTFNLYHAVYVIPETVKIQTGDSYTILMKDDILTPVQCFLNDGTNYYELELETAGAPAIPITQRAPAAGAITSLGDGNCGFKLDNVTTPNVVWNISFTDEAKNIYSKNVVAFLYDLKPRITKIFATVGDSINIECGVAASEQMDSYYCELYNPSGDLELINNKGRCYYLKHATTIADFGTWKCMFNTDISMANTEIEYEVISKPDEDIINTWTNETETHVDIGCSITNPYQIFEAHCIMVRPDGKKFALTPGKATQRYTSIKTNLSQNFCNMEILKPLHKTEEGLWRCELHSPSPIGGFIDLSTSHTSKKVDQVYTPRNVVVLNDSDLLVRCRVPYSSPYCYMIGANGLTYQVENYQSATLGLCEFAKTSTLDDKGTWYCGFATSNGEPDKLYPFNVNVLEHLSVKPENETVISKLTSSARLLCTTDGLGGNPLNYCRFRNPNGDAYFIQDKPSSNRISYSGRGLKYGDCGILISNVTREDEGSWSCITSVGNDLEIEEVSSTIRLIVG